MRKLRIGLDIDSVIANTEKGWNAYFKKNHHKCGHDYAHWTIEKNPVTHWDYHSEICKTCFHDVLHERERVMELEVNDRAQSVIWNLAKVVDLFILTSRPEDVHHHTIAWLQQMHIYQDIQKVVFSSNKAEDAALLQLDYHLEDAPHHIAAIRQRFDTIPLIYDTCYNKEEEGIRLFNWTEVEHYLTAAATEHFYMCRSYVEDE